jgi:5-methylcytosine-specific restriction endonuclease McrA
MATNYVRLKKCDIEKTLKAIIEHNNGSTGIEYKERDKRISFDGEQIKLSSLRLRTFATHGIECVDCGVKASFFAMERHRFDEKYHLNLWAVRDDGEQVLMTHDHILARSLGGADNIANTQTMCMICNFEKGKIEHKLKEIRKAQKLAS